MMPEILRSAQNDKKCGYVSIIGKPNAGKSTLMNKLLGWDLSIVNRKAQTTRNKIVGVLSEENYQIIFLDTPGILEPKYELQKFMAGEIKSSFEEADVVITVIDVLKFDLEEQRAIEKVFEPLTVDKKRICVLNKIDLMHHLNSLPIIDAISKEFNYKHIIPVSAETGFNIEELTKTIVEMLPEGEFYYDKDTDTDRSEKFFAAEIIRKIILDNFHEEIPYSVFVDVVEFKERENGKDLIHAEIIVERDSQKAIIIGKGGESLKLIGERARREIEKFLDRGIFLKLFVKVRKGWRKDPNFLKNKF